tara:strand:+ start:1086 stop:3977 length:2892 start_codon:yes stop_codon:yes gene_type:complete
MAKLGSLVVNIGANTKDLNMKLGRVRRDMRKMSSNFKAVGANMTRNLSLPLLAIGAASANLAVEFESSMAAVKAVSGATAGEFKKLEQSAKDLGASTIFTAREVAALQLEYSRLGFSAAEILQVQEATLNLAQATGSDLAQAAEVAGSTVRQFGLDVSETGRVTDVMAASFSSSALQIDNFQDAMSYVGPVAKAAGVSVEETAAMLGVLANSGIKGSKAGTSLKRILEEMKGTSGSLTERFKQLGDEGITVGGAMDEVGRRAGVSLIVLADGAKEVENLTTEFGNAEGAAKSMADIMNNTAKGSLKEMTSALEGAGIALGEVLIPFVIKASEFIKDLATKFRDLSPTTQGMVVAIGGIVAALGPLLFIVPQIVAALPLMGAAFAAMTGPVGLAVAGIALLAVAIASIVHESKEIPSSLTQANSSVRKHSVEVRYLVGQYKDELTSLEDRQRILDRLATIDATHFGNLQAESTTYSDLVKNLDNYTSALRRSYLEKALGEQGVSLFGDLAKQEQEVKNYEILIQKTKDAIADAQSALDNNNAASNIINDRHAVLSGEKSKLKRYKDALMMYEDLRLKTLWDIEAFEKRKQELLEKYTVVDSGDAGGTGGATPTTTTTTTGGVDDPVADGSIDALKAQVAELTAIYNSATIGSDVFKQANTDLIAVNKELDKALGNTKNKIEDIDDTAAPGSIDALRAKVAELTTTFNSAEVGSEAFAIAHTNLTIATLELDDALGITKETLTGMGDGTEYPIGSLGALKERLTELQSELLLLNPETQAFVDKLSEIEAMSVIVNGSIETIDESIKNTTSAFKDLGVSISDAFVDAVFEAKSFGDAMLQIGKQLIKTLLGEAIASAIASAASSKNIANQASGGLTIPGFILGAVASVKGAFNKVPALAAGGLAFGETMSIVGDNRNAALDPEVIAPLSKLKDYIGGGHTNVYGRISGDDIVISNSRGARDRNRFV